jgi:copper chaperone CopZ
MGAIYRVLGSRTLMKYLTTIAVGSVAFGLLFNMTVDPAMVESTHMHEHHSWWAAACAGLLFALLAWFAWEDARSWLARRMLSRELDQAGHDARTLEVAVQGMTCGSCVSRLERVIGRAEGVASVVVTLEPGRAVVQGDVSAARVRELIEQAGFRAE